MGTPARGEGGVAIGADQPVIRDLELVARSGIQQKSDLVNRIRSQQFAEMLKFPVQRGTALTGALAQQQGIVGQQRTSQFDLRNRAIQNRLSATLGSGQLGLGLMGTQPNLAGTTSGLLGQQASNAATAASLTLGRERIEAAEPDFFDRLSQIVGTVGGGALVGGALFGKGPSAFNILGR